MTESDFDKFSGIVVGFAELKGKALSAAAIRLYWGAMKHWDLAEFTAAAEHLLRASEFMPTPKDFEDLRKASGWTHGEAWTWALSRYPAHRCEVRDPTPKDRDLIERAVQAIGGWHAIDMCEVEKIGFLERRFQENFETMRDRDEIREAVPQLTGGARPARVSGPQPVRGLLDRITTGTLAKWQPGAEKQ